jgi:hypothetical protein
MRAWLRIEHHLEQRCGSLTSALGALGGGTCGGAPALVRRRMKIAGVSL